MNIHVYENEYWKVPVLSLKVMGLWPFDNRIYNKIMPIIIYILLFTILIPIGIRLFQELNVLTEIVIENFVGLMYLFGGVLKITMAIRCKEQHKKIFNLIAKDWSMETDEESLKTMKKHAALAKNISLYYGICCSSAAGLFLGIPSFYPFLDYIIPLENETRPLTLPFYAEYFIDQEKYYFPLMAEATVAGTTVMLLFLTYDVIFTMCVQHTCSLFNILNLQLKRASVLGKNADASKGQEKELIIRTIYLHRRVIENVKNLEDAYNITWLVLLILNTAAIGAGLFIVLLKLNYPLELIRYGMFFISIFAHKYYIFLPGQKIIDCSLQLSDNCYFCKWYNMSTECKVLINIMMICNIRPLKLTGGKMFPMCMETYASMLKMATSYFAVVSGH